MSGTIAAALPRTARAVIGLAVAGGAVAVVVALVATGAWAGQDAVGAAVILGLMLVAEYFWVALPLGRQAENFSLVGVIFTVGLILVRPGPLLVAVALGIGLGQLPRRPPPEKLAFNVGMHVCALGIAALVVSGISDVGAGGQRTAVAAIAGMAAYFVVNEAAVALIIALVEGRTFGPVARRSFGISLQTWVADVALGLIAALIWEQDRRYMIALLAPLALTYSAVRSQIRTTIEAEKMREMAQAAAAISQQEDLGRRMPETDDSPHLAGLAATLNRMLDRIESAFDRERRFIRDASHELRTPLTITRGYLEVLGDDPDPDELREAVDVGLDELDRMARLIADLTTLAKIEDAGFVLPERVELDGFMERLTAKARSVAGDRLRAVPWPRGLVIAADEQRLTQALLNLLQNAVVHADGGTLIDLRVQARGEHVRFEVADDGPGLPPGEDERIFQPFHRVRTDRPGSGLGLAIVKGIAEGHHGGAGVVSRPGLGATFWVEIPRAAPSPGGAG